MARKTKKQKETARLRREIEALRAEFKKSQPKKKVVSREEIDIRPNLKKTALLTAVSLLLLIVLTLTQPHWPWLVSKLPFFGGHKIYQ